MARMQGINQKGHVSSLTLSGFIAQAIIQNLPVQGVGAVSNHQKTGQITGQNSVIHQRTH